MQAGRIVIVVIGERLGCFLAAQVVKLPADIDEDWSTTDRVYINRNNPDD